MKKYLNPFVLKCFAKTLLWALGNACFGLGAFMFVGFLVLMGVNNEATKVGTAEFFHLVNDGSLVFFFCALMGAVAVDLFLARKKFADQVGFTILFIGSSLLILFTVIITYFVALFTNTKGHVFEDLPRFQFWVIVSTGIFTILAKTILFIKEDQL